MPFDQATARKERSSQPATGFSLSAAMASMLQREMAINVAAADATRMITDKFIQFHVKLLSKPGQATEAMVAAIKPLLPAGARSDSALRKMMRPLERVLLAHPAAVRQGQLFTLHLQNVTGDALISSPLDAQQVTCVLAVPKGNRKGAQDFIKFTAYPSAITDTDLIDPLTGLMRANYMPVIDVTARAPVAAPAAAPIVAPVQSFANVQTPVAMATATITQSVAPAAVASVAAAIATVSAPPPAQPAAQTPPPAQIVVAPPAAVEPAAQQPAQEPAKPVAPVAVVEAKPETPVVAAPVAAVQPAVVAETPVASVEPAAAPVVAVVAPVVAAVIPVADVATVAAVTPQAPPPTAAEKLPPRQREPERKSEERRERPVELLRRPEEPEKRTEPAVQKIIATATTTADNVIKLPVFQNTEIGKDQTKADIKAQFAEANKSACGNPGGCGSCTRCAANKAAAAPQYNHG